MMMNIAMKIMRRFDAISLIKECDRYRLSYDNDLIVIEKEADKYRYRLKVNGVYRGDVFNSIDDIAHFYFTSAMKNGAI